MYRERVARGMEMRPLTSAAAGDAEISYDAGDMILAQVEAIGDAAVVEPAPRCVGH